MAQRNGTGMFAREIMNRFPLLPLEEEGRPNDMPLPTPTGASDEFWLWQFLDRALGSQGQICFVTGEAGSGKTALVTEFARRTRERHTDPVVAVGQCDAHTGIGDPYLPFREVPCLLTRDATMAPGDDIQKLLGALCDPQSSTLG